MASLLFLTGPMAGRRIELSDRAAIGRHSTNAIVLHDERVSRFHLLIERVGDRFSLRDLGSGNGTLVNGEPAGERLLQNGDEITIGDSRARFEREPALDATLIIRSVPAASRLGVLTDLGAAIQGVLDLDELLARIVELLRGAIPAEHAAVLLTDAGTGELMPHAGEAVFSRTIMAHALREGRALHVRDAAGDSRFADGASIARHSLQEVIAAPMRGRHESVGALVLATTRGGFSAEHLELATAIAQQAALAVEATRSHQALLNAERLAAVGQTIAGMSHHIRNILQGLRFGGDMIRSGLNNDAELVAKGWRLVEKNQARIESLISDMLSYSKPREPEKQPIDLGGIVRDVVELMTGRAAEKGIRLDADIAEPRPMAEADPMAMHDAILNLVANALDAARTRVIVGVCFEGRQIVTVEDDGPGVSPEQREAIFEPFVSGKGARGTGLGLPVSRKIAREHDGELTVESSSLGGARFVLVL